jgi:long-chain acyl-CoA synthetase
VNLATNLLRAARRYPDNVALRLNDMVVTYARFDELSAAAAGELQARGVRSGDQVGIMLPINREIFLQPAQIVIPRRTCRR